MSDTPTTPIPDYGEPFRAAFGNAVRDRNGQLTNLEWSLRDRAIACMNACAGMADPEREIALLKQAGVANAQLHLEAVDAAADIAAMREAIRQAQVALQDVSRRGREFEDGDCPHALSSYLQTMAERSRAKLQPFITP